MSGNRKAATAELVKWIDKFVPGANQGAIYKERLDQLSDEAFDQYMLQLESGEETVYLVVPNLDAEHKLTIERNFEIAKELGHEFFQQLWLTDPVTRKRYLTPTKALVMDLPLRRQQQLLIKKISMPEDNHHIDEMTGQPAGPSKGSKASFPEIQVLFAQGLDRSIEELIKFRGGDNRAYRAMSRAIVENGGVQQDAIKALGPTRVKSTETFSTFLNSMHLANTL